MCAWNYLKYGGHIKLLTLKGSVYEDIGWKYLGNIIILSDVQMAFSYRYSTGIAYAYAYSYDITTYLDVVLCLVQSESHSHTAGMGICPLGIVIIILAVTFSKSWNQENTSYAIM